MKLRTDVDVFDIGLFIRLLMLLSGLLLTSLQGRATPSLNRWALVTQPAYTQAPAESIGDYAAGCLSGAGELPADGEGYQAMRLSRKRLYGHPDLIRFIEKMGRQALEHDWGTLLIGDLGQPRGGPTLSGHSSHQSGLDVDIWFLVSKQAAERPLTDEEREVLQSPSVLSSFGKLDAARWSPTHERMLKTAALMPEVERIFVNPAIKRKLCNEQGERLWLNKVRPWWGHDDHFHVRLSCPDTSVDCTKQAPPPPGDGCDASLDWWFTDEARHPVAKKGPPPVLPERCEAVLNE
ncbi:MAG: penicillin-insensitive murein endopeptidase [Gammaproteobacteria bacterium]